MEGGRGKVRHKVFVEVSSIAIEGGLPGCRAIGESSYEFYRSLVISDRYRQLEMR